MKIYMISLKRDIERREQMQKKFPRYYPKFHIIDAVDAKDESSAEIIQKYDKPCPHDKRRPLTKGEKCCAISHLLALEDFLQSGDERCIIIEDDIIGTDDDFDEAISLLQTENPLGLTVLGGQEGLRNSKYIIGSRRSSGLWELSKIARRFLLRTCCYSIDIATANAISSSQLGHLSRADNWSRILSARVTFFYTEKFKHPVELDKSNLESERKVDSLIKNIHQDGLIKITTNIFAKIVISFVTFLRIRKKIIPRQIKQ